LHVNTIRRGQSELANDGGRAAEPAAGPPPAHQTTRAPAPTAAETPASDDEPDSASRLEARTPRTRTTESENPRHAPSDPRRPGTLLPPPGCPPQRHNQQRPPAQRTRPSQPTKPPTPRPPLPAPTEGQQSRPPAATSKKTQQTQHTSFLADG
jgi:hypothetical protein